MNYYIITQWAFPILSGLCLILIYTGLKKGLQSYNLEQRNKTLRNFLLGIGIWIVIISGLALSGFLSDFSTVPPRIFIVLIIPLIVIISLLFTKKLGEILQNIPPDRIIYLQSFRVVVEILLWMLFVEELLPVQMTFEGRNFDILVGATAPLVGYFCFQGTRRRYKGVAIAWNIVGLLILLNIVVIAILSTPTLLRYFMNEPANTIVATFPFVLLPGILVPVAYSMHLFSLKQLLKKEPRL